MFANPFLDPNWDNPSIKMGLQKPLKVNCFPESYAIKQAISNDITYKQGLSKEKIRAISTANKIFQIISTTGKGDGLEENLKPMYDEMAIEIGKQRKRLGGDWAVAQAVFTRNQRNMLRRVLGPDLVFIVLNMTKDCQMHRIKSRHGDSMGGDLVNIMLNFFELCEPAGEDEENAFNVTITEDMNRDDVMEKILEIANKS